MTKMARRIESAVLVSFFAGVLVGASVGWNSWNGAQDKIEELEQMEAMSTDAWMHCSEQLEDRLEDYRSFEQMVREQVTEVITDYECDNDPFHERAKLCHPEEYGECIGPKR